MRQDMPGFGVSRNGPHEWRNSCHGSEAVRRSGRSPALWLDSLRHLLKPEFGCFRKQVHRHRWFAGIVSVRRWGLQDHNRLLARLSHYTPSILTKFLFSAPDSLLGGDIICISAERTGSICPLSRTCFPRKLRGSALSERTGSSLTLEVLDMVVRCCKPRKSLVFHSNRGILYADSIFREQPESHGILPKLVSQGRSLRKRCGKNFSICLKCELLHPKHFPTRSFSHAADSSTWRLFSMLCGHIRCV